MLDVYTVSFFGHRELPNMFAIEDKLLSILREIINTHEYVEFLVGRDGDCKHPKRTHPYGQQQFCHIHTK